MDRSTLKIRDNIIKKFNLKVKDKWETASHIDNSYHAYCTFIGGDGAEYCFSIGAYTYVLSRNLDFLYQGFDKNDLIKAIAQVVEKGA